MCGMYKFDCLDYLHQATLILINLFPTSGVESGISTAILTSWINIAIILP